MSSDAEYEGKKYLEELYEKGYKAGKKQGQIDALVNAIHEMNKLLQHTKEIK